MSIAQAPPTHVRRLHINPWLVAVIALAAGLVALGTWTLVDRSTTSAPAAAQIVDELNAAVNAGNAEAVRALFAPDAVFQPPTGEEITGLDNVVNAALIPHGIFRVWRVGPVATEGDSVATFTAYGSGAQGVQPGIELAVFRLEGGKIVRMWVYNEGYR